MALMWDITEIADNDKLSAKVQRPIMKYVRLGGFPNTPDGAYRLYEVETGEFEEVEEWTPLAQVMIFFAPIAVGVGNINLETEKEFFARLDILQKLGTNFLLNNGKQRAITQEEVSRFRGLKTNVGYLYRFEWVERQLFNFPELRLFREHKAVKTTRIDDSVWNESYADNFDIAEGLIK